MDNTPHLTRVEWWSLKWPKMAKRVKRKTVKDAQWRLHHSTQPTRHWDEVIHADTTRTPDPLNQ
jgi:hypothetical protein